MYRVFVHLGVPTSPGRYAAVEFAIVPFLIYLKGSDSMALPVPLAAWPRLRLLRMAFKLPVIDGGRQLIPGAVLTRRRVT